MGCSHSIPKDMSSPQDIPTVVTNESQPHDTLHDNTADTLQTETKTENVVGDKTNVHPPPSLANETPFSTIYQYIYEYERKSQQPGLGWGSSYPLYLLPSDKGRFSNEGGTMFGREEVRQVIDPSMRDWELVEEEISEVNDRELQKVVTVCALGAITCCCCCYCSCIAVLALLLLLCLTSQYIQCNAGG